MNRLPPVQTLHFAASGIETSFWLPPLAGRVPVLFCSMVGIFGAPRIAALPTTRSADADGKCMMSQVHS